MDLKVKTRITFYTEKHERFKEIQTLELNTTYVGKFFDTICDNNFIHCIGVDIDELFRNMANSEEGKTLMKDIRKAIKE